MSVAESALVPTAVVATAPVESGTSKWAAFRDVPLRLSVDIALPSMSLRALGALRPGQVLPSAVATADDLTVAIGGSPVCMARFEYVDGRMAIRLTRLIGAAVPVPGVTPHTAAPAPGGAHASTGAAA